MWLQIYSLFLHNLVDTTHTLSPYIFSTGTWESSHRRRVLKPHKWEEIRTQPVFLFITIFESTKPESHRASDSQSQLLEVVQLRTWHISTHNGTHTFPSFFWQCSSLTLLFVTSVYIPYGAFRKWFQVFLHSHFILFTDNHPFEYLCWSRGIESLERSGKVGVKR